MAKKRESRRRSRLVRSDSQQGLTPDDFLHFIELPAFTARWKKLGLDDEHDLWLLQLGIMADPKAAPPIKGTRGIRKLRFAPARWKTGKSGAVRVLYVYFEDFGIALLCLVYGKGEVGNISTAVKTHLNKLVVEVKGELRRLRSIR